VEKLTREGLLSLEAYSAERGQFREEVMAHKRNRHLALGANATLYFEDRLTMQYQVQEMLRIERIFEAAAIEEELAVYNPLIPDGANWKATFMIEYTEVDQRNTMLRRLIDIENKVWMQVDGLDKIWPIADEDMERTDADKTSAVHFMRFELSAEQVAALKGGAELSAGIDHENYQAKVRPVAANIRQLLLEDLD